MRFKALVFLLSAMCIGTNAHASGFGWYACSVEWNDFSETLTGIREEAHELLGEADTPRLRAYLQLNADSQVVDNCDGTSETPNSAEFYSLDLAQYALSKQNQRGIKKSYFSYFLNPPDVIVIQKRDQRDRIDPIYFVLSPDETKAFLREVADLNKNEHPRRYKSLLLHLEAVLMKAVNDNWDFFSGRGENIDSVSKEYGNGEQGMIFYGHD